MFYRLCRMLTPFHFNDARAVLGALQKTGAVISGSAALHLFFPSIFEPNDIDFYVPIRGFPRLLIFAMQYGYSLVPWDWETEYDVLCHTVVKLVHPASGKSINIIVCPAHVVGTITQFHSTLVMNYIAWYGVVSLYPSWTMQRVGLIVNDTPANERCFQKYRDRGFKLERRVKDIVCDYNGRPVLRYVNDKHCSVLYFDKPDTFSRYESPFSWSLPLKCAYDIA